MTAKRFASPAKPKAGRQAGAKRQDVSTTREDVLLRLRRIEGQVRGIQRMVEEDRACREILDQLSAVQQALRRVSALVLEKYALECFEDLKDRPSASQTRETAAELAETLLHAPR